jgi:hypothetical protein
MGVNASVMPKTTPFELGAQHRIEAIAKVRDSPELLSVPGCVPPH